jgi:hypothetical protein
VKRVAWLVFLVACGGGGASPPETEVVDDVAQAMVGVPDTTYPQGRRGAMTARAAAPGPFVEVWHPTAGACASPPSVQLLAIGDSVDVMMVLRLSPDGPFTGTYPVTAPEDTTAQPQTARMAVQLVSYADRALRAARGSVEVSRLDRLITGRFDVVLEGFSAPDTVRLLGVFDRIPVDSLPETGCQAQPPGFPPEAR